MESIQEHSGECASLAEFYAAIEAALASCGESGSLALLVVSLALVVTAGRLNLYGHHELALLTVPAAFVVALVTSLWWERIFLRELGAAR